MLCVTALLPPKTLIQFSVFQVLEHLTEPSKMLGEAFRVLHPGGWLLLSAPMTWRHHEEPLDFFRYTRYGLLYLVEQAGFQVQNIAPAGGVWRVVGQNLAAAVDSAIRKKVLAPIRIGITTLTNILFAFLDHVNPNDENTCNFAVLARRGPREF